MSTPEIPLSLGQDGGLVWTCTHCGKAVEDGTGYFEVDRGTATRRCWESRARDCAEDGTASTELVAPLDPAVEWRALHRACDWNYDNANYWVAVERCRALPHFLHWTARLSGKVWLAHTNWCSLVAALGEAA